MFVSVRLQGLGDYVGCEEYCQGSVCRDGVCSAWPYQYLDSIRRGLFFIDLFLSRNMHCLGKGVSMGHF